MKNGIWLTVFFLMIFMSCTKESSTVTDKNTYSYFASNLTSDMNYDAIVAKFGEPSKDIGSGIYIYVYILDDATEIWVGYAGKILYAKHMDKNQRLMDNLI